ncbi:hypothetical protein B0T18DRAFT_214581 [Schizothecium vesticola]|uniref:Uncharacterized protein n=1 Tax=Schizothecium vesticola TaxID=314040 RepID=A0AA40EK55_9PEZI|nr:hypothetical protein B0T18DRAFT_214581 [Schizothecium vesticola]
MQHPCAEYKTSSHSPIVALANCNLNERPGRLIRRSWGLPTRLNHGSTPACGNCWRTWTKKSPWPIENDQGRRRVDARKTCAKNWTTRGPESGSGHSEPSSEPPPTEPTTTRESKRHLEGARFLSICDPQPPLEPPSPPTDDQPTSQPKEVKWTATNKTQLQALSKTRPDWPPRLVLRCGGGHLVGETGELIAEWVGWVS